MRLVGPGDDRLSLRQFLLVTRDVENARASKDEVDLIRFGMSVDTLLLSRFKTVEIAEITIGFEDGNLLHLPVIESNEILDRTQFHGAVRALIVGEIISRRG